MCVKIQVDRLQAPKVSILGHPLSWIRGQQDSSDIVEKLEFLSDLTANSNLWLLDNPVCHAILEFKAQNELNAEQLAIYLRGVWILRYTLVQKNREKIIREFVDRDVANTMLHESTFEEYISWRLETLFDRYSPEELEKELDTVDQAARKK